MKMKGAGKAKQDWEIAVDEAPGSNICCEKCFLVAIVFFKFSYKAPTMD